MLIVFGKVCKIVVAGYLCRKTDAAMYSDEERKYKRVVIIDIITLICVFLNLLVVVASSI